MTTLPITGFNDDGGWPHGSCVSVLGEPAVFVNQGTLSRTDMQKAVLDSDLVFVRYDGSSRLYLVNSGDIKS